MTRKDVMWVMTIAAAVFAGLVMAGIVGELARERVFLRCTQVCEADCTNRIAAEREAMRDIAKRYHR